MRNTGRITAELKLLCRVYGESRIHWAPDYSWIEIKRLPLPEGLSKSASNALLMVPDRYGYGVPLRELYVDPDLRVWWHGAFRDIPHYFDGTRRYAPNCEARERNWRYLCLHAKRWRPQDNVLTFLTQVMTFLSNPFWDWEEEPRA